MQFSTPHKLQYDALILGDEFQELFNLQGVKPYLPDKTDDLTKNYQKFNEKDIVEKRYMKKVLPWDIEARHIIENRERLRNAPIGIKWTKEEMDKFNSLTDIKEKRAMILEKSQLKSVYIPHLKWDKYMINFPNMPHTAKSKDSFEKGYKLYNEKKYDEAFPLLADAYTSGNYVAGQLVATILFHRLRTEKDFRNYYYQPKHIFAGINAWIDFDPEKNRQIIKEHDQIIKDIRSIAKNLAEKNLPIGYFLYAETYYHYLDNLCANHYDKRYRKHYIKYLMQAANMGSYDAYMRLAINDGDLEWVLAAMIVSHDYKCFDEFVINFDKDLMEFASPRNLAIVRLAAMWGSNYAMDCLTFGESGNFISTFNHLILDAHPNGAIYMPNDEIEYRKSIYAKYYGEATGKFEGTLIPDLDTVYPPKPVIHSPYDVTPLLHYYLKDDLSIIHPLAKNATKETILKFREQLHIWDEEMWLDEYSLEETKKYKDRRSSNDARRDMAMVEFEDIDRLFGYLNVMKMRELEQNPLYYPSARIYIYPKYVYDKHPDWY